ncbi:glutamine amidotransferase [Corynebacterium caspium]|uniref:glutamine amidotransferase n=1 Tax=Corynebacterium caspium TaxID=234828 RepID=UPI00037AA98E|nr:glutamine amidotransferase [Corynebacterium caspium]WKD59275.1 GMP synthase [glutamine-hydrolyzing] [Corynebacterium caspium DSM 44850]
MSNFLLVTPRQGDEIIAAEYADFLGATGLKPEQLIQYVIDSADVELGDISKFTGILMGGSPLNMTDPEHCDWQLNVNNILVSFLDSPVPVFSMCYGGGPLAVARGGAVGNTHPEQAGPTIVELCAEAAADPLFSQLPPRFDAFTGHNENVTKIGEGAVLLATGPTCPVQAVRFGDHIWATQFHPEIDAKGLAIRMNFYRGHGYFSEAEYEDIVASLDGVDTSHARKLMRAFVEYATAKSLA